MKKVIFYIATLIVSTLICNTLYACLISPISKEEVNAEVEDMKRFALKKFSDPDHVKVNLVEVGNVSADHAWFDSIMCPDGLRAEATFKIDFTYSASPTKLCTIAYQVSKTERRAVEGSNYNYVVKVVQKELCLESASNPPSEETACLCYMHETAEECQKKCEEQSQKDGD